MGNWIDYRLDVLANSPAEINQIAEKLNQPSLELAGWIAQKDGHPVNEITGPLKSSSSLRLSRISATSVTTSTKLGGSASPSRTDITALLRVTWPKFLKPFRRPFSYSNITISRRATPARRSLGRL